MKFEADRDRFAEALAKAASIALSKDISMLRNVVLKSAADGRLEVIATDLEVSLWTSIEAQVQEAGALAMPAKQALDIVRGFMESRVSVEARDTGQVHLRAGKSKRRLPAFDPVDFPLIEIPDTLEFRACDKAGLVQALSKPFYCIPRETDAFNIAGLFLLPAEDSACRALAVDGHRLAYQDVKGGFPLDVPATGLAIPLKGVQQMLKHLDADGEAAIADQESRVILKTTEGILSLQLLEFQAPLYDAIIPAERPRGCSIDVEQLQTRLNSLAPLTAGKWNRVGLAFTAGRLGLEITTPDAGEGEDEMPIEYDDEAFTVHLNYRYLKDLCKSIGAGRMNVEWVDDKTALVFREPHNPAALHLIMPMVA